MHFGDTKKAAFFKALEALEAIGTIVPDDLPTPSDANAERQQWIDEVNRRHSIQRARASVIADAKETLRAELRYRLGEK